MFPMQNGGSFHSYVNVYQRVCPIIAMRKNTQPWIFGMFPTFQDNATSQHKLWWKNHLWQTNVLSVRNQLWNRKAWTRCFKQTSALFPSWSTFVSKLAFDLRLSTESAEGRAKGWLPACAHGRKEMQIYLGTCTNILLLSETRVPRNQFHQLNHIGLLLNLWIVCGFIPHFLTREVPPTAILLALPAMNRDVRALSSKNDGSSRSRHSFMTPLFSLVLPHGFVQKWLQ